MEDVVILVDAFFAVGLVIVEYHFAKAFDSGVKSLAFVGFGEFFYKLLQVRVLCNHEGCDGNVQFSSLGSHVVTFFYHHSVQAVAVFVVLPIGKTQATRFAVSDHEDLLIRISFAS
jgi:hypothetical protein